MKLLFDQNLSPALVGQSSDIFPGSAHVRNLGLERATDETIWDYAREHGFTIVSKDEDFHHLSFVRGAPPQVIGLSIGNCSTTRINELLRARRADLFTFAADPTAAFLPLP